MEQDKKLQMSTYRCVINQFLKKVKIQFNQEMIVFLGNDDVLTGHLCREKTNINLYLML